MHDCSRKAVLQPVLLADMPHGSSVYDGHRSGKSERASVALAGGGGRWLMELLAAQYFWIATERSAKKWAI
jgi:hypothetical protein